MENGIILDSKYKILSVIGQGGMSTIYLAEDLRLHKQWAIKAVDKKNHQAYLAIRQEIEVLKNLDHPGIIRIIDCIDELFTFYIVMDYISGNSLEDILKKNGLFNEKDAVEIGIQICKVIAYLHGQHPPIIYRDMKPANVMRKENGRIVLIDLGISQEYSSLKKQDTTKLGTRQFAAPEQFEGLQSDERTDIYSVGKTIYALLTYQQNTIDLNPELKRILYRCIEREKDLRYSSVETLIQDLQSYQDRLLHPQNRNKHRMIRYLLFILIFFLTVVLSAICFEVYSSYSIKKYNEMLLEYSYQQNDQYLIEAIEYDPFSSDAYFLLIESFKEDHCFDLQEEMILKKNIDSRLNTLRQSDFYESLLFEVGKLYWYYYEEENEEIRIQQAYRYMQYVDNEQSKLYNQIASFILSYHAQILEGIETGDYADFFNQLVSLRKRVSKEGNPFMMLQSDNQMVSEILSYYPRLISDGIAIETIENILNTIKEEVSCLDLMNTDLEQTKAALLSKIDLAYEVVKEEV